MRHLCIRDYYSSNYGLAVNKGYIYSVYVDDSMARVKYCHAGDYRSYDYSFSFRLDVLEKFLVPIDENSEEHLFELALKHGVIVKDSLISFKDMINTPE